MSDQTKSEPKSKGTTPSQVGNYQRIASKSDDIIGVLFAHLHSRNENISLGAAKTLINKILPDLKSTELTGKDGEPFTITVKLDVSGGYIPQVGGVITSSTASSTGSTQVQSDSVAPESKEDDNSTNGDNQAGPV
jgi:hypothetical protein